jgi:parallel beta-helix repeat protein
VAIKTNNVSNTQYGIAVVSDPSYGLADGAIVSSNTVSLTHLYDGIDLCSDNNKATGNTISGSEESGIHLDDTCPGAGTGNTVTSNKNQLSLRGHTERPGSNWQHDYSEHVLQRHHSAGNGQQHVYASAGCGRQSRSQVACANQGSETVRARTREEGSDGDVPGA